VSYIQLHGTTGPRFDIGIGSADTSCEALNILSFISQSTRSFDGILDPWTEALCLETAGMWIRKQVRVDSVQHVDDASTLRYAQRSSSSIV
jgi:hypothetical protein